LHRDTGNPNPNPAGIEAYDVAHRYFYDLASERRLRPTGDMMSELVQAEVERDDGTVTRLSDEEISNFGVLLCGAGSETVTKLMGSAAVLFSENPDQWHNVLEDPTSIPAAVEEVLRYFPPSEYQGRYTRRTSVLHDVTIPADQPLLLLTRAACHDEREFPDPDRFDISRSQHVSIGFGHGIHSCLGAALARLESKITIEEIRRRWPNFRVDLQRCARVTAANVAGYAHVPIAPNG
ncbi:MAG TPA: cytochrome P450, partial [Acidimicrobiales bacterium]